MFRNVIGPNGIDFRTAKGKDLLFLLNSIKFRVLLTSFKHNNYTTCRSFNYTRSPHMLDNFICSQPLFSQVKNCKVGYTGMRSDQTATLTSFKTTAIKFKVTEKVVENINWKLIGYHKLNNYIFNNSLSKYIAGGTT